MNVLLSSLEYLLFEELKRIFDIVHSTVSLVQLSNRVYIVVISAPCETYLPSATALRGELLLWRNR